MGGHVSMPLHPDKMMSKQGKNNPAAGPFLRFAGYDPSRKTDNYRLWLEFTLVLAFLCLERVCAFMAALRLRYVRFEDLGAGAPNKGHQPAIKPMQNGNDAAPMQNGNGTAHVEVSSTTGAESKHNLPGISTRQQQLLLPVHAWLRCHDQALTHTTCTQDSHSCLVCMRLAKPGAPGAQLKTPTFPVSKSVAI
eukprot:1161555-Pelagomonas_calceolata.AAC.17